MTDKLGVPGAADHRASTTHHEHVHTVQLRASERVETVRQRANMRHSQHCLNHSSMSRRLPRADNFHATTEALSAEARVPWLSLAGLSRAGLCNCAEFKADLKTVAILG